MRRTVSKMVNIKEHKLKLKFQSGNKIDKVQIRTWKSTSDDKRNSLTNTSISPHWIISARETTNRCILITPQARWEISNVTWKYCDRKKVRLWLNYVLHWALQNFWAFRIIRHILGPDFYFTHIPPTFEHEDMSIMFFNR